ncbi:ABC transporter permease [Phyllobacterium endophyticum]|uniref:Autoinducer 2 import system permease protein LsrD n=1 Tax=Phyllobacterium endophyticum TaxID=1149773 RepID=A0A2P7AZ94_9HYPH|nr:ABC transporter permease [Phyllobacterium endophyticum]MBB3235863.1 rhamnose transport system permease protein [Phyllobacterium endophyticum]PSH59546.1 ABC transporter permease [Phyllobacterium endophyticum]TYR41684.1 ABC transporter permease [Phyllobacterium endophyticum]
MTNFIRRLEFWDLLLLAASIAVIGYGIVFVPNFFSAFNLSQLAASASEKALLVLPMALLIIVREIDLSVASILALTSVLFGLMVQASVPLSLALPLTLLAGGILGAFNGYFVAYLGLPSLVVTLGTMAMYRGIGYILLGTGSINILPDPLLNFGIDNVPGTSIPQTILPFLILAPVFAVVLQKTSTGKRIYALGGNPLAALYSGIAVKRITAALFVSTGIICAIAGIVYTARLANARANNALGMELDVITIVLLGGVSVFGGKGKLTGVLLALVLLSVIRNLLALNQIGGDAQGMVIGLLLIGSLLFGNYSAPLLNWFIALPHPRKSKG